MNSFPRKVEREGEPSYKKFVRACHASRGLCAPFLVALVERHVSCASSVGKAKGDEGHLSTVLRWKSKVFKYLDFDAITRSKVFGYFFDRIASLKVAASKHPSLML